MSALPAIASVWNIIVTPETAELDRPVCPRCGEGRTRHILEGQDHLHATGLHASVVECTRCGLWFQSPRFPRARHGELYPPEYAPHGQSATAARPPHPAVRGYLARHRGYGHLAASATRSPLLDPILGWRAGTQLIPAYVPGGRVMDIGCGSGGMLRLLQALGWTDLHGIEPDPAAAAIARSTGADVRQGAVEDVLPVYPDGHFDAIVASMVIEHVADPYAVMREIARTLRPGGELLLSTVTRDSMDAAFFGEYWAGFDFPRHMTFFRNEDIAALFAERFDRIQRFPQLGPIDWVRSASWRSRPIDRLITRLGRRVMLGPAIAAALAGRSTRVSLRARRLGAR
ncbi:MAG: class I SAM-dependent methyltransferase [Chloroflexota bacterium]|nr:class I SAM-dependent methyltransferase [Chloroflexota bacterium]